MDDEARRRERAPSKGKFCIWVELKLGIPVRMPDEFDVENDAKAAAKAFCTNENAKVSYKRILVYDDKGSFRHFSEPDQPSRRVDTF